VNSEKDFELNLRWPFHDVRNYSVAGILLFAILILIYSNSFDCSWHYDDFTNIVGNENIRINNLSWPEIKKSFNSWSEIEKSHYGSTISMDTWSRPISYFSFGLNYYFGGLNVSGYHAVNFLIHYLSAFFLFLFIYTMLQLPLLAERYGRYAYSASLLSATLWAIHPIQVTAVTYLVQRMASMASLFYIMAMYLYLKGRTAQTTRRSVAMYFLCFTAFVFALGSKQNAAMLPVSLILLDLFFIQGINRSHVIKTAKVLCVLAVCALITAFFYVKGEPSAIDYSSLTFSMAERLLSQPRVFFYYISLLFYPLNSRLMLIHDFNLSSSLFDPWTTLIAVVALVLLLGTALWKAHRMPLMSYCFLFFFINHLIEGSFFSLELVYEHRNYLPGMLFFLPIVTGLLNILDLFTERKLVFVAFVSAMSFIMMIWGVSTFMYNSIFKNEITLWSDSV
jgi:protein O-mannosyl-transferase